MKHMATKTEIADVKAHSVSAFQRVNAETLTHLKSLLAGARAVLEKSVASETSAGKASAALIKSRAVVKLAEHAPGLKPRLSQMGSAAKKQLAKTELEKTAQLHGLAQLNKDLGRLLV